MSWNYYIKYRCNGCNHDFEIEKDTLTIATNKVIKCPICGSQHVREKIENDTHLTSSFLQNLVDKKQ